mgnify:CR=1 FL=1
MRLLLLQLKMMLMFEEYYCLSWWAQMLMLGAMFITTGFFVTAAYGALGGWFASAMTRRAMVLNRIASVVFAALALRLVKG